MRAATGIAPFCRMLMCGILVSGAAQLTMAEPENQAISARIGQAKSLEDAGDYDAAAQAYQEAAAAYGKTPRGQQALAFAAAAFARGARIAEAIEQYDAAIKVNAKPEWTQTALYNKALLLHQSGRTAEALPCIQRLRMEFPESDAALEALDLEATVSGTALSASTALKQTELTARQAVSSARMRLKDFNDQEGALKLIEPFDTSLKDTAMWLPAMQLKGQVLQRRGDYGNAAEVYMGMLSKLEPLAPESDLANEARFQLAESTLRHAHVLLDEAFRQSVPQSDAVWKAVSARGTQVLKLGRNPRQMADARIMLLALRLASGDAAGASSQADLLVAEHTGPKKLKNFPKQVLATYLLAGEAARRAGRVERAMECAEKVKTLFSSLPGEFQQHPRFKELHAQAYFQVFLNHLQQRSSPDVVRAAGEEVKLYFPDSPHAEAVEMRLLALASPSQR